MGVTEPWMYFPTDSERVSPSVVNATGARSAPRYCPTSNLNNPVVPRPRPLMMVSMRSNWASVARSSIHSARVQLPRSILPGMSSSMAMFSPPRSTSPDRPRSMRIPAHAWQ
jgi:hypothetical protein